MDGLFVCLHAVLIYLGFVFLSVGQAPRAADAAADACHALDKVGVKQILALFEKRYSAFLDTVAGARLKLKALKTLLFKSFLDRVGKSAAAGEYPSEIRGVVKSALVKCRDVHVPAVKGRLKVLKGYYRVNVGLDLLAMYLGFFCGARTDKDDLCPFLMFLYVL